MTGDLLKQGIAAARAGRTQEARQLLMQVTDLDEQNELAWLWLSQVVDSIEDKAICLENVLALNPDNANARAGLAWLGQRQAAISQPPLTSQAAVPGAAAEPGAAEPGAAEPGAAEPCPRCGHPVPLSKKECTQCGLPLVILCPRCRSHIEVNHVSCPHCQAAIGDWHAGAAYQLDLAEAYTRHGHSDLAPRALERAQREAASDPAILVRVAELYCQLDHPQAALAALDQAAANGARDAGLQARLGVLYGRLDRPEQARATFERATQQGGDPVALLELARIEIAAGRAAEARELLIKVTAARPLDAAGVLLLGDSERALGNEGEARRLYQHAAQLTPRESPVGREAFSRLVEIDGRSEAASWEDWRREQRQIAATLQPAGTDRPGCVTAYAVWLALSSLLTLCGLAVLFILPETLIEPALAAEAGLDIAQFQQIQSLFMTIVSVVSVVTVGVQVTLAAGLWFMKNWARLVLLALHGVAFALQLVSLLLVFFVSADTAVASSVPSTLPVACGPLGTMIVAAVIIYWFATNGRRFS